MFAKPGRAGQPKSVCKAASIPTTPETSYLAILDAVKDGSTGDACTCFLAALRCFKGRAHSAIAVSELLARLRDAGLGCLPGTAAEILDDEVRAVICPDKLDTRGMARSRFECAHRVGLPTTATIMFGHVDNSTHWARHLVRSADLQEHTGGFTEFVPLPFVHMEAPIYFKGRARRGPTWREAILMHAVSRLVLHPLITNIQVSWVKTGHTMAPKACWRLALMISAAH